MIDTPFIYDVIFFDKVRAAGLIVPGSLDLSPSFEFDAPTSAGVDGAYVIFKGYKPAAWSVNMLCFRPDHMSDYKTMIGQIGPKPGTKNRPKALTVRNGWFALRDIKQVYISEISLLKKESNGGFSYTIKGMEYRTVKKNPVVPIPPPPGNAFRERTETQGHWALRAFRRSK